MNYIIKMLEVVLGSIERAMENVIAPAYMLAPIFGAGVTAVVGLYYVVYKVLPSVLGSAVLGLG
jgi:hypothetical protein